MTAKLPRRLEQATVATMWVNETRWARPSAMQVSPDRSLWLRNSANVASEPSGFHSMRITLQDDGYHVWPDPGHYYGVSDEKPPRVGTDFVPVQELHEGAGGWKDLRSA